MEKPKPYNEEYKGTREDHFRECLMYSRITGKAIPLEVFKSLYRGDTTKYLMEIREIGINVLDN